MTLAMGIPLQPKETQRHMANVLGAVDDFLFYFAFCAN